MQIALTNFHQCWGGQAQQVFLLARALAARGHGVLVLSPAGSDLAERAATVGLSVCSSCQFQRGFRPLRFAQDTRALYSALRDHEAEIVHCHGSQDTWLAALVRAVTCLSFALVRTKHNRNPVRPHVANRWLYGRALDRLITISKDIRDDAVAQSGMTPARAAVVHPGLPDDFAQAVPADAAQAVREEFRIPQSAPLVGQIARLDPVKGQTVLLQAFGRIRETVPEAHLLLIGTGTDYDRLQRLRDELGFGDCVHIPGFRDDTARLTAALSVSVTASLQEGWGMSVMEAMLLGVPVVVTDSGGPGEIVEHGALGAVVPPNDAEALARTICAVLQERDSAEAQAQRAQAQERVRSGYLMHAVVAQTEAHYREALALRC